MSVINISPEGRCCGCNACTAWSRDAGILQGCASAGAQGHYSLRHPPQHE